MKEETFGTSFSSGWLSWTNFMLFFLCVYAVMLFMDNPSPQAGEKQVFSQEVDLTMSLPEYPPPPPKKSLKPPINPKKTKPYQHIISKAADRHKVDPDLIRAIIMAESSYNPRAVSKRGAKGLMQLMPRTAKALGVKDCFNPEHNIEGGTRYISHLLNRFDGDVELALAAYNAGARKVRKHRGIPPYKATQYYIKKVGEYYRYYKERNYYAAI